MPEPEALRCANARLIDYAATTGISGFVIARSVRVAISQPLSGRNCNTGFVATGLYPGSFDPFHLGHLAVVARAATIFDEVIVAVVGNPQKRSGLLPIPDRVRLAAAATAHMDNVHCLQFQGLTAKWAERDGVDALVRSGHKELGNEVAMATMNEILSGVPTTFVTADPMTRTISSTFIRDLVASGDITAAMGLVPPAVGAALQELRDRTVDA